MNIVEELRNKKSEYNRKLLDRAADRIEELEFDNEALRQHLRKRGNGMTEQQMELYKRTKERMRRLGIENPAEVIVALAEEVEYYRNKIHAMEGTKNESN